MGRVEGEGQREGLGNSDQWHMLNLTLVSALWGVPGKGWVGDMGTLFPECCEGPGLSGSPVP